jgi:biopolymer transport protein ExbD
VKLFCSIDASALAAVILVLAVVWMIVESVPHHGYGPDLPRVWYAVPMSRANREDAMVVTVMRDSSVYFGADKVAPYQVRSKILGRLKDRSVERNVYIRADSRAWYGEVKPVLDGVRSSGIERVAFFVDQRRLPTTER